MKIIFKDQYKEKEKKLLKYFQNLYGIHQGPVKLKKLSKQRKVDLYKDMDKLENQREKIRKKLSKKKQKVVVDFDEYNFN
jgi:N-methylhydantoinase B/oxoprolinase/acetone carboxylase alpha subunit